MPENQFFETQSFSSMKGAHIIFFRERHVPATRVSSQNVLGGFTSVHMGGRAAQMSRKGTSLMAGSCSCWSQNYTFLSFCQKQSVILVTLYFPHCSFPCNYWIQLDIPCCIITQLSVSLKDMKIIMKVHSEKPPSKEWDWAFYLPDNVFESENIKFKHLVFSSICYTHEQNFGLVSRTNWLGWFFFIILSYGFLFWFV